MTYRWDGFHGRALYELNGLPNEVRHGLLLERLLDLLETPWDAVPERPGQTAIRHASSARTARACSRCWVDDEAETLRIIDTLWMG